MYSPMYNNFSLIALFDTEAKEPFIEQARQRGYIPCCYSVNPELLELMNDNSPHDQKVIGVIIMIEYKLNELTC